MQILTWALPSGFLSSVVTWLVTRRQRNNDFLASLQKSIDLLTDNAHLLANQKVMEEKIDALNKKIDQLTKQLKTQNEKSNSGNSPRVAPRRPTDGGVRSNQEHDERADGLVGAEQLRSATRSAGRRRSRHASACTGADADGLDDDAPGVYGAGSGGADGHDDSDAEPP